MARTVVVAVLCGMTICAPALSAGQDRVGVRRTWWSDPDVQRDLELTASQVTRLAGVFNRDLPARRALNERIRQLDAELAGISRDEDDVHAMRLIGELAALRRQQNTGRSLMLLEMYRILTPVQRRKLARYSTSRERRAAEPTRVAAH